MPDKRRPRTKVGRGISELSGGVAKSNQGCLPICELLPANWTVTYARDRCLLVFDEETSDDETQAAQARV